VVGAAKHNGRVTFPPCGHTGDPGDRDSHSPSPWTRQSEAEERELASSFLTAYAKQVEGDPENDIAPQPLETERPHPFVPSQTERHAQFTETGRMPFWTRHCLACDNWAQNTPHDPFDLEHHPHAQTVR
jgi:hypothetical protein